MNVTDYLKKLQSLKAQAVDRWGNLSSIERDVVDGSFDWLIDNLEIKRGTIIVDEDLSRIMDEFIQAVVDTVNKVPAYQSNLKKFLQDLTTIQTNNKLFHSTTNNFNINTAGVNDVQKAVVGQIIDQYTANGLNAHFAAPLKENIFRNILAGANMREVKQVLQAYIVSGQDQSGKLSRYLTQTSQQAVDSYTGAINQQLKAEFKFDGYIISGSLIETSSEQCVFAVEESNRGYLSFKEWEEVLEIARNNDKAKLIPGTTVDNLPLNKLHWGCRHDFTPVIDTAVPKEKPKDGPKPAPKEEPKPKPEKKPKPDTGPTPIGKAKTMKQAKEDAKTVTEKTGIRITGTKFSSKLTLDQLNRFNEHIERLVDEYEISPITNKGYGTKLSFSSTSRAFSRVFNSSSIPFDIPWPLNSAPKMTLFCSSAIEKFCQM